MAKRQSLVLSESRPQLAEELSAQAKLRQAMFGAISEDDVMTIVKNQVAKAKDGDNRAIEFVMNFAVGGMKPQKVELHQHFGSVEDAARAMVANKREQS